MGHKVEMSEVTSLSNKVTTAYNEVGLGLETVIDNINAIRNMESFSGKAASSAKTYFGDFHVTVSNAFQVLFNDLNGNLKKHIDTFHSNVDSSATAIVQMDYLEEIRQEIDLEYKKLQGFEQGVLGVIDDVSDIVSISKPTLYNITNDYRSAVKTIDELDKNINSFTKKGKSHNTTTKELIHNIEVAMRKANAALGGKDPFGNFDHGTANSGIIALKETIKWMDRGKDVRDAIRADRVKNKIPTPNVETKTTKETVKDIAKNAGKKFTQGIKDGAKKVAGFDSGRRALGPIGGGLSYYSNYHDAKAQGLKGKDAHIYAAEDTAIDIALGSASVAVAGAIVAGAAAVTGVAAVGAVAVTATVIVGWGIGKLLDVEFGKTKQSVSDRVKKGYRKLKSWFF